MISTGKPLPTSQQENHIVRRGRIKEQPTKEFVIADTSSPNYVAIRRGHRSRYPIISLYNLKLFTRNAERAVRVEKEDPN